MDSGFIETGCIVNTHGVNGRLRVQPWADSPEHLKTAISISGCIIIDGAPVRVLSAEVHKSFLLVSLEGVDNIDSAIRLKNKTIYLKKDDFKLEEGTYFIADLIGLTAVDAQTGDALGKIDDVLTLPAHNVYFIKGEDENGEEREMLIPAVEEFITETNIEEGYVKIKVIEGM